MDEIVELRDCVQCNRRLYEHQGHVVGHAVWLCTSCTPQSPLVGFFCFMVGLLAGLTYGLLVT